MTTTMPNNNYEYPDRYAHVQDVLDNWTYVEDVVALTRLSAQLNNGTEHFDHSPQGYSWLCLACAKEAIVRLLPKTVLS